MAKYAWFIFNRKVWLFAFINIEPNKFLIVEKNYERKNIEHLGKLKIYIHVYMYIINPCKVFYQIHFFILNFPFRTTFSSAPFISMVMSNAKKKKKKISKLNIIFWGLAFSDVCCISKIIKILFQANKKIEMIKKIKWNGYHVIFVSTKVIEYAILGWAIITT